MKGMCSYIYLRAGNTLIPMVISILKVTITAYFLQSSQRVFYLIKSSMIYAILAKKSV